MLLAVSGWQIVDDKWKVASRLVLKPWALGFARPGLRQRAGGNWELGFCPFSLAL
jgi:hypothetical protein